MCVCVCVRVSKRDPPYSFSTAVTSAMVTNQMDVFQDQFSSGLYFKTHTHILTSFPLLFKDCQM